MSRGNTQVGTSDRFAVILGIKWESPWCPGEGQTATVSGVCRQKRRGNCGGRRSLGRDYRHGDQSQTVPRGH